MGGAFRRLSNTNLVSLIDAMHMRAGWPSCVTEVERVKTPEALVESIGVPSALLSALSGSQRSRASNLIWFARCKINGCEIRDAFFATPQALASRSGWGIVIRFISEQHSNWKIPDKGGFKCGTGTVSCVPSITRAP